MGEKLKVTAWNLWGFSFLMVILVPSLTLCITGGILYGFKAGVFVAIASSVIHSLFYALAGIPVFLLLLKWPKSACWSYGLAPLIGGLLALGVAVLITLLEGIHYYGEGMIFLVLFLYGVWTGFVVSHTKKRLEGGVWR